MVPSHTSAFVHNQLWVDHDAPIRRPFSPRQEQHNQQRHNCYDSAARGADPRLIHRLRKGVEPCKSRLGSHCEHAAGNEVDEVPANRFACANSAAELSRQSAVPRESSQKQEASEWISLCNCIDSERPWRRTAAQKRVAEASKCLEATCRNYT